MHVLLGIAQKTGFFLRGSVCTCVSDRLGFPAAERAKTGVAASSTAAPVAVLVGAPVCKGALLALDGRLGLAGWQIWLFLVEGFPADHSGVARWLPVPHRDLDPEQATCVPTAERLVAERRDGGNKSRPKRLSHPMPGSHLKALLNGAVPPHIFCIVCFGKPTLVTYGVFLWLPSILRDASGYRGWRLSTS